MKSLSAQLVFLIFVLSHGSVVAGGQISGRLILDDSWEREIYLSLIDNFDKEYTISNNFILTSSHIDEKGNFQIDLSDIPESWSLLRLHVVKKEVTPYSLVIGSTNENFMFLIANRDSEILLSNTIDLPIFGNLSIKGAPYMDTFHYIKKLVEYPNSLNYENALIEKEFIIDAVNEKLKMVADTCTHPLVALYALNNIDFLTDFEEDSSFYQSFLEKWNDVNGAYFSAFRRNFPQKEPSDELNASNSNWLWWLSLVGVALIGIFIFKFRPEKKPDISPLSVKEREVFELLQKGLTNKEISEECNIELTTVKSHVSSIYSKLKIKSRKEAMDLKFE